MANRCIITDSQNQPLAHAILENSPEETIWRVQVLDGGIKNVLEHEVIHLIGMTGKIPGMEGSILRREGGDRILVEPVSTLDEDVRQNLRVPFRFDSFLYPVTGTWKGRLSIICHDLSCGGIAFFCGYPLQRGEIAELVVPITTQPLLLKVKILRIRPSNSAVPLLSAKFVDLIHDEEVLLREAVFSQQLRNHARR